MICVRAEVARNLKNAMGRKIKKALRFRRRAADLSRGLLVIPVGFVFVTLFAGGRYQGTLLAIMEPDCGNNERARSHFLFPVVSAKELLDAFCYPMAHLVSFW